METQVSGDLFIGIRIRAPAPRSWLSKVPATGRILHHAWLEELSGFGQLEGSNQPISSHSGEWCAKDSPMVHKQLWPDHRSVRSLP